MKKTLSDMWKVYGRHREDHDIFCLDRELELLDQAISDSKNLFEDSKKIKGKLQNQMENRLNNSR